MESSCGEIGVWMILVSLTFVKFALLGDIAMMAGI